MDEGHDVLQEFIDDRADEIDWDLQVKRLNDSKLWLVVARASVIESDIEYT